MSNDVSNSGTREMRNWWFADTSNVEVRQVEGMKLNSHQYYVASEKGTLIVESHLFGKREDAVAEVDRIIRQRHAMAVEQLKKLERLINGN